MRPWVGAALWSWVSQGDREVQSRSDLLGGSWMCQCDIQHRDRDTALTWQKLQCLSLLSAAEQGQELTVSVECPWGTSGRRGAQASQCWDSHPDAGPNSLPCPVELCFPSLSSKAG